MLIMELFDDHHWCLCLMSQDSCWSWNRLMTITGVCVWCPRIHVDHGTVWWSSLVSVSDVPGFMLIMELFDDHHWYLCLCLMSQDSCWSWNRLMIVTCVCVWCPRIHVDHGTVWWPNANNFQPCASPQLSGCLHRCQTHLQSIPDTSCYIWGMSLFPSKKTPLKSETRMTACILKLDPNT